MKYLVVPGSQVVGRSPFAQKSMDLEAYNYMIQNPTLDQTEVTRDFLLSVFAEGDEDKYLKKEEIQALPQLM